MERNKLMKRFSIFILLALLPALVAMPALAQDAPPETAPDATIVLNIWQVIGGVIAAVSIGGIAGIAGVGVLASRLRNDEATMKAIEALANSAPKHVTDALASIGKSTIEIGKLLEEVTDGVPMATKEAIARSQLEVIEAVEKAVAQSNRTVG
jgi:hypothetical protein